MRRLHLLICVILIIFSNHAGAIVKGNLSLNITSGNYFYSDHNQCASGGGPRASYLALSVRNISGSTQNNISVQFIKYTHASYTLAGGQAVVQQIPLLANSGSDTLYWYSTYPCAAGNPTSVIFRVTDLDDNSSYLDTLGGLSVMNQLSSNGGGLVGTSSVSRQDPVGGLFCYRSNYNYPKLVSGDVAYLQPTTNLDFDAASFQLESAVVLNSTANSPSCIPVGNSPFNYNISANCGNSFDITIEFCFRILSASSTQAYPYNSATSGEVGLKYVITSVPVGVAPSSVLPVELSVFTASAGDQENTVRWQTLSEENSALFEVQRSADGIHFYALHTREAAHYSNAPIDYSYTDEAPLPVSYYRLRMIDLDGSEAFSDIAVVISRDIAPEAQVIIYPNPSADVIKLQLNRNPENARMQVYNLNGQLLREIKVSQTGQLVELPVSDMASGVYQLRYVDDKTSFSQSFIKP